MEREKITPERFEHLATELGWEETRAWILRCLLVGNARYDTMAAMTGKTANALYCDVRRAWQEIYRYDAEQRGEQTEDPEWVTEHAAELQFAFDYEAGFGDCLAAVRIIVPGFWKYTQPLTPEEEQQRLDDVRRAYNAETLRKLGLTKPENPFNEKKSQQRVDNSLFAVTE